jgi:anti-sigma regulatory factor (Ser/Thr protein kinase)
MPYVECPGCGHSVYSARARHRAFDVCPVCGASLVGASRMFVGAPATRALRREFAPTPGAVADARHAVDGLYGDLGHELHATVVLLISELVTNSVLHANAPNGTIELVLCANPLAVRVEVRDDGEGFEASAARSPHPDGGHGLKLVDSLADRWAMPAGDGTRVRFEIDRVAVSGAAEATG